VDHLYLVFQVWFGLWGLMPLSAIFQLYCGAQFCWCRKPENTTDLSQVTDKLSYNVVPSTPRHEWVRTHNFSGDREIRPSYIIKRTQFLLLLHLLKFLLAKSEDPGGSMS